MKLMCMLLLVCFQYISAVKGALIVTTTEGHNTAYTNKNGIAFPDPNGNTNRDILLASCLSWAHTDCRDGPAHRFCQVMGHSGSNLNYTHQTTTGLNTQIVRTFDDTRDCGPLPAGGCGYYTMIECVGVTQGYLIVTKTEGQNTAYTNENGIAFPDPNGITNPDILLASCLSWNTDCRDLPTRRFCQVMGRDCLPASVDCGFYTMIECVGVNHA